MSGYSCTEIGKNWVPPMVDRGLIGQSERNQKQFLSRKSIEYSQCIEHSRRERGRRPVEIKSRRKDKAGGDRRSPSSSASSASPPPDWLLQITKICLFCSS
ncbi:hypothetical protein CMV_024611 [Castanea mollissima]|uniref:Uncharacterized protein n=1 Tax=Castanea mollissima TaxID=60419 RepID=A0A8J4QHS4_9ROSI|nr:hypothetical protein CMV_024611 [Castanea mollissima]